MIPPLISFNDYRFFHVKPRPLVAVFFLVAAITGCNGGRKADYDSLNLVQVTGRITMDGQSLPGVSVIFEDDKGHFSYGTTDESGEYELLFNSEQPGVTPGSKIVRIRYGGVGEEEGEEDPDSSEKNNVSTQKIPPRYNSDSELTAVVTQQTRAFNFDLESKP